MVHLANSTFELSFKLFIFKFESNFDKINFLSFKLDMKMSFSTAVICDIPVKTFVNKVIDESTWFFLNKLLMPL